MRFTHAVRTAAAVLPLLTTLLAPTVVHADARPVLAPGDTVTLNARDPRRPLALLGLG